MPHLRSAILLSAAALALPNAGAIAREKAPAPAVRPSPFLGRWELDLSRMPDSYGPPPTRVLYTFEDAGEGRWRTIVDITDRDGRVRHMAVSYRPDGSPAPAEADATEADKAAIMVPTPDVMVMNLGRSGMLGSVRVYIVAPGGRAMTESAAALTDKGEPFVRNFHYRRVD